MEEREDTPQDTGEEREAEGVSPNGTGDWVLDGPAPTPYARAQRRLRVDVPAFLEKMGELQRAEGWSLRTLSKRSGVPLTTLAKLARGGTETPEVEVLTGIALTFGYGSPGAMLAVGGTARRVEDAPGHRPPPGPGPMTLDRLVETVLRGVWAAQDALPPGLAVPLQHGSPAEGLPGMPTALPLPGPAGSGITLYVNLVVLIQPTAVAAAPPPPAPGG